MVSVSSSKVGNEAFQSEHNFTKDLFSILPNIESLSCETKYSDDYIWFDLMINPLINHKLFPFMNMIYTFSSVYEKQTSDTDLETLIHLHRSELISDFL